jgi:hypothetical protein
MTASRAPQTHVNADGLPKRVFESERAAAIEAQRLDIETRWRWTWYVCGQRPEHWHLARMAGGVR